jgi:signal transduction histidine kinase
MKADECDLCRTSVLSLLSHELRNPLAAIGNSLYVLKWAEPGGAKAQRAITTMERQIGRLSELVSDLTDAARINQGKVELRRAPIDVCELVRDSAKARTAQFADREISIDVRVADEPILIWADRARMEEAIGKLLDNAARFTEPGGNVAVWAERDPATHRARIHVQDSGIGFADSLRGRLFEPFTQGDRSLARSAGGLGLGLVVVKGLVELHGGEVRAQSEGPGRGSLFTIELPLLPTAHGQPVRLPATR